MPTIRRATLTLLPAVAFALAVLPMTSLDAAAAMKKKGMMGHAAKGQPSAKGGAMKSGAKGKSGDPLNDAAGKKM